MRIGEVGARFWGVMIWPGRLELVSGVVHLRPEETVFEAMLHGWWAQQSAHGLRKETTDRRERLVRRFHEFTNEFPWTWMPGHVDEWSVALLGEAQMSVSTVRGYQIDLRLFSEYVNDGR